jgi:hypothetical protein
MRSAWNNCALNAPNSLQFAGGLILDSGLSTRAPFAAAIETCGHQFVLFYCFGVLYQGAAWSRAENRHKRTGLQPLRFFSAKWP